MRVFADIDRGAEQLPGPQILHALNRLCTAPRRRLAAVLALAAMAVPVLAERALAAGPDDGEIRIGNTMPYSGPAAAYGVIGKVIAAYFDKVNTEGGINGRKIKFISYDDGYNPAKTMELTKKLVEEDKVLLTFAGLGTDTMAAVQPYLNASKVPQLFIASGATMWDKPREFPWTTGFQPSYQTEGHIYAEYLLENHPRGKIAVLYQDDAFGKDYLKGLKDGLSGKIPVVAEATYKVTDTSIDAQIAKLKASGADVFVDIVTPKFAALAIKRTAEIGWKPVHIISSVSRSLSGGAAAGRAAGRGRRVVDGLHGGRRRSGGRQRSGLSRVQRVPRALRVKRSQGQFADDLRICHRADHGRGAEAKRRRPVA